MWGTLGNVILKALPVIGSVVGGIFDKASQDSANKANAQNVQAQLDFQREQNSTAYQRAVADITKSGLNPALAYSQGGASSGAGAAAEAKAVMHGQRLTQAIEAYNQMSTGTAQRQLIREQARATQAQARKTSFEANAIQPEAFRGTNAKYLEEYQRAELERVKSGRFLSEKTPEQYEANLKRTNQGTATAAQHANLMRTEATLNEQEFMNEYFRKNIAPYLNSTARAVRTATGILPAGTRTTRIIRGYD